MLEEVVGLDLRAGGADGPLQALTSPPTKHAWNHAQEVWAR